MEEKVVRIRFLDHCEDGDKAMEFYVYGVVLEETAREIKVGVWQYTNEHDREMDQRTDNETHFVIVKAAILELTRYQKEGAMLT